MKDDNGVGRIFPDELPDPRNIVRVGFGLRSHGKKTDRKIGFALGAHRTHSEIILSIRVPTRYARPKEEKSGGGIRSKRSGAAAGLSTGGHKNLSMCTDGRRPRTKCAAAWTLEDSGA